MPKRFLFFCTVLLIFQCSYGQIEAEGVCVYTVIEDMPLFQHAKDQNESSELFSAYINERIKEDQPKEKGTVYLTFIVDEYGKADEVKVYREAQEVLEKLAVKYILETPKWKAGEVIGRKVKVEFKIPIKFEEEPSNNIKL